MVEDAISFWTDIQRYEDMLAADPRSYCFVPLSELYRKLGLLDDAISVAQKGCSVHPDYPGGFFALGAAFFEKGMKEEAIKALEKAATLQPDGLKALQMLGQLYVEVGRLDQARKVLEELLRQNPDDTESELLLRSIGATPPKGAAQPEEEQLEEADVIEELTEVLDEREASVRDSSVRTGVAEAFAELEELVASSAGAKEAHHEDVFSAEQDEEFWAIEATEEEPAEAEPVAEEVRTPLERDPLTTPTLAELYVSQGFIDKALVIYRKLISAEPGNQGYPARAAQLEELKAQQQAAQAQPTVRQEVPAPAAAPAAEIAEVAAEPLPAAPAAIQTVISPPAAEPEGAGAISAQLAVTQPASPMEGAPSSGAAGPAPGDLEAQLTTWLENIRRRRDGV